MHPLDRMGAVALTQDPWAVNNHLILTYDQGHARHDRRHPSGYSFTRVEKYNQLRVEETTVYHKEIKLIMIHVHLCAFISILTKCMQLHQRLHVS